jgi:hypothetical protein
MNLIKRCAGKDFIENITSDALLGSCSAGWSRRLMECVKALRPTHWAQFAFGELLQLEGAVLGVWVLCGKGASRIVPNESGAISGLCASHKVKLKQPRSTAHISLIGLVRFESLCVAQILSGLLLLTR